MHLKRYNRLQHTYEKGYNITQLRLQSVTTFSGTCWHAECLPHYKNIMQIILNSSPGRVVYR